MISRCLTLAALILSAIAGTLVLTSASAPRVAGALALLAAVVLALAFFLTPASARPSLAPQPAAPPPAPPVVAPPPAPAPAPVPPPAPPKAPAIDPAVVADAAALRLLARFQEQARLIDFAMEDIRSVPDAQVAAAARVVHAGCRALLQSGFALRPLRDEAESAEVTLPAGFDPASVRLLGRVAGNPPYIGRLLHRGWRCDELKLPRPLDYTAPASPVVAPAEVELR